jgi:hypothetical protein
MKKIHLAVTLQHSTFFIQDLALFFLVVVLALLSPFFTWKGLHYDLFTSAVFFIFFNQFRYALLWATLLSFYIDIVTAMPLGSTGIFVLSLWFMNQVGQSLLKKKSFMIQWCTFLVIYLAAGVSRLMIIGIFLQLPYNVLLELYSYVLTVCCYPILCSVLADVCRFFKIKAK